MNKISLLVLAAGMGSRYKGSKQVDSVSVQNESLMEFGLFDALRLGIDKFVFIINDHFPDEFKNKIISILKKRSAEVHFINQKPYLNIPGTLSDLLKNRKKPLGTGHAVYCAKSVINEPFITMNADDYYGRTGFEIAVNMLKTGSITADSYGMIGYKLVNTISENGSVSRGVCGIENNYLIQVEEFVSIQKNENKIEGINPKGELRLLDNNELVSMNFWILHPSFFDLAKTGLNHFFQKNVDFNQSEFYLPSIIDDAIQQNIVKVKVETSPGKWFGLTYPEDKKKVVNEIIKMKSNGLYPEKLWE